MSPRSDTPRLLALLGLGGLVFAGGLALALARVPEWRLGPLPAVQSFTARYHAMVEGLSLRPAGKPKVFLNSERSDLPSCAGQMRISSRYAALCTETRVTVQQSSALADEAHDRKLAVGFSLSGEARSLVRTSSNIEIVARAPAERMPAEHFVSGLLQPGERIDAPRRFELGGAPLLVYGVLGSRVSRHLTAMEGRNRELYAERLPGDADHAAALIEQRKLMVTDFIPETFHAVRVIVVCVLFVVLCARRRIGLVNGAMVALVVLVAALPTVVASSDSPWSAGIALAAAVARALWVFLVWSAAESFLRAADPGFTTSLDALRAGRLGPRGGRALLLGLALGAGVAGLRLAVQAAAVSLRELWPLAASLQFPVFSESHDPFGNGILLAAFVVLLLGFARRLIAPRWAAPAVIVAGAIVIGPVQLHPYAFELAANALFLLPLVLLGRRAGLTALLTATISSLLLPPAAFSGLHLNWLPGTFAATAGPLAGILVLGLVGLARPAQVEAERLRPPGFMRRIEEERRIKYEMNLLARMQEGLLPQSLPELPGWEVAARSILATEAGGDLYDFLVDDDGWLWVAAGDVAGHGYSCAIVQAMTTAALASLISPKKTPAEVLRQIDRVIRRGGTSRNFITLVLLRLDPRTGEVLLSNAGHPYPFLVTPGEVTDVVEVALPSLPLGQGPAREYRNHLFQLPPGGALVICSDGLIESRNWREEPYGFDRPRDVLLGAAHASAGGILDVLLADWRRHLGREELPDDTTVVVVKRAGGVTPSAIP